MIRYRCPRCKKALVAQDGAAGSKLNCSHCGQRVQVPAPPPLNKTVLGTLDDAPNRTVLGKLEEVDGPSPLPSGTGQSPVPPVPRTILVETALPADEPTELGNASDQREGAEDGTKRRRRRRSYGDDDDYDRRRRRGRPAYRPCPECGCTDYPRQTTEFGGTSIALLIIGIIFWPLIIVSFFVQEKWDVCPECGEKLRRTGTGF
ncbi:MAG TPA: hypothetical protein VJ739_06570 [Gemmataceae bacterium]|nr:hypothetical protein [Gemmataceae bacterium]